MHALHGRGLRPLQPPVLLPAARRPERVNKFNVVLSFQNLKNVALVLFFLINDFFFILVLVKQCFALQTFPAPPFCNLSPFIDIPPHLKNFLHPSPYFHFWEAAPSC